MAFSRSRSFEILPSEFDLPRRLQLKRHSEDSAIKINNYGGVVVVGEGNSIAKAVSKTQSEQLIQTEPPRRDSSTMTDPTSSESEADFLPLHEVTRRDRSTMTDPPRNVSSRIVSALSEFLGHIRGKLRTQVAPDSTESADCPESAEDDSELEVSGQNA